MVRLRRLAWPMIAAALACEGLVAAAHAVPPAPGIGFGLPVRTIDGLQDVRAAIPTVDGALVAALGAGGVVRIDLGDGEEALALPRISPIVAPWPAGGIVEAVALAAMADGRIAVVDLRLRTRLRAAGIAIDADAIARERRILLATLDPDEARAESLLVAVRAREQLGDARFAALLARNAGLRALVAGGVTIDEAGIAAAHDMLHGPRRVVRIAVFASLTDAERFAADLANRPFADLAVERSLDESAARGGLLAPFARRDPSYPEPVRAAAFATAVGATSAPVLDGARFHVLRVESERPSDGVTTEASRAACERWLRLSRERLLMDALARELASMDGVTVFDRGFDGAARARP